MMPDAYDPMLTRKEIRNILVNVYHADEYEYGLDEISTEEMRSLLDSYIRGVQQVIDKVFDED